MTTFSALQRWLLAFAIFALVIAPGAAASPSARTAQGSILQHFLIITTDLFASHLDEYIDLKQSQGFFVTLVTLKEIPADTAGGIHAYIKDLNEVNPIDYLLLVGDVNFIPTWDSESITQTDVYYGDLSIRPDSIPEIYYGRVPVRNVFDLGNWIDKMLAYEQASGQEDWAKKASFIAAGEDYLAKDAEEGHNRVIENHTRTAGFSGDFPPAQAEGGDKLYAKKYEANRDQVITALNSGRMLAVYNGLSRGWKDWKSPEFTQEDVRQLSSPPIPLVLGLTSHDGADFLIESMGDSWVTQVGAGALAFIGTSSDSDIETNAIFEEGFFDKLFSIDDKPVSIGQAFVEGVKAVGSFRDCKSNVKCTFIEPFQLYGDPSLQILLEPRSPDFSLNPAPAHTGVCKNGNDHSSIQLQRKYGFDEPVFLDVSGLPAGLSVTFDPEYISPEVNSASMTITAGGAPPDDYLITVQGRVESLIRQTEVLFSVHEQIPQPVMLLLPIPYSPNAPLRPVFTWETSPDALNYDIEIATGPLFDEQDIVLVERDLLGPPYTPSQDLLSGTTYWWRVRAVNACGEENSLPSTFTTRAEPGQCAAGGVRKTIFNDDFESEPPILCHPYYSDGWELSQAYGYNSGTSCFAESQNSITNYKSLISPLIPLPGLEQAPIELSFYSKHEFESLLECKDGGLLEISLDGGAHWDPVPEEYLLSTPYDDLISSDHANPLGNQRAWCGTRDWERVVALLDPFAGETINLRWRLGTDDLPLEGEGWYIDDVAVTSCQYPRVSIQPASSRVIGLAGATVVHSLWITNHELESRALNLSIDRDDWTTDVTPETLTLSPDQSEEIEVSVTIPADAEPGDTDRAMLSAVDKNNPSIQTAALIETRASPYRLSLNCMQPRLSGFPGKTVSFQVEVSNTGAEQDTFTLKLSQPSHWLAEILGNPARLNPGETGVIQVNATIPASAAEGEQVELKLMATSWGNAEVEEELSLRVFVEFPKLFLPLIWH